MKSLKIVFGLLLAAGAVTAQQYNISTIAGIGTVEGWYGDGFAATSAELGFPLRVALDSQGNYFIVDFQTWVVREVTAKGIISTIAGTGTAGFTGDGDLGTLAKIADVHAIAVDKNGNVYIADTSNSRVRKIDSKGIITTFAGNGTRGFSGDGAAATSAQLTLPGGLAVDGNGNVYISDYGNATVRKVTSAGTISTVAGTGTWGFSGDGGAATKANLASPYGLAVDTAGNLYISDTGNSNIRKVGSDGTIQTVVSGVGPESIAVDTAGNIYYADGGTNTVRKIFPNGSIAVIAGNGTGGYSGDGSISTAAQLNLPSGVAVDAKGNVYVTDSGNMAVRLLVPDAKSVGILNAASGYGGVVAPGELVVIYGTGLGPATLTVNKPDGNGVYSNQLAGTVVSFNGVNAPIVYTSSTQVVAVVPYAAAIGSVVPVALSYQGATFTAAVSVASSAPGIFTANASGAGQAAAINQNGTVNSAAAPAPLGSTISLYVTGEGLTTPGGIDGKVAGVTLPRPLLPVSVTLNGQPAVVTYAGGAPGSIAGLMQVNVQIPATLIQSSAGPVSVPVVLQVGFIPSQQVAIAVSVK